MRVSEDPRNLHDDMWINLFVLLVLIPAYSGNRDGPLLAVDLLYYSLASLQPRTSFPLSLPCSPRHVNH